MIEEIKPEIEAVMQPPAATSNCPPEGFCKGVNDYLGHHVVIADAKAAAFLAASLGAVNEALESTFKTPSANEMHWISIIVFFSAVCTAAAALFPRLSKGSEGTIFWEHIADLGRPSVYEEKLKRLTVEEAEMEYARQNFYTSKILRKKHLLVRWTISLFLIGISLLGLAFVLE